MDFCTSPWPSVYTYFVTFGHRLASAFASPLVIRRQLFPPKPSETDRVICLGPHQAGAAPGLAAATATVGAGAAVGAGLAAVGTAAGAVVGAAAAGGAGAVVG